MHLAAAALSSVPPPTAPATTVAGAVTAVQQHADTVQWLLLGVLAVALLVIMRRVRRLRRTHRHLVPRPSEPTTPLSERSSSPDR